MKTTDGWFQMDDGKSIYWEIVWGRKVKNLWLTWDNKGNLAGTKVFDYSKDNKTPNEYFEYFKSEIWHKKDIWK